MREVNSWPVNEPRLKTRIRRWRRYQPAANLNYDKDLDAETTPQTSSMPVTGPMDRSIGLRFINTAHPHDATSSTAISRIRSHVARDIHASRRESASQQKEGSRKRKVQMDTGGDSHLTVVLPVNPMIPLYNGLLHCFVRPITKFERFLLDYYATSIIPDARRWCHRGDEEPLFIEGVRLYWLPFVVTDSGLLAGVFLSSCRNLALRGQQAHADYDFSQIAVMYKLECIRSVNAAIAAERPFISETTIAKTLLLCADEFMCKNLGASALHFEGMNKMIELKGGLSDLGIGGFLRKSLEWCNLKSILEIRILTA